MKSIPACFRQLFLRSSDRGRGGSILVAFALILVVFLFIAACGVDLSRYVMLERRAQKIADSAALAGAEALNQFTDNPDETKVYSEVLRYIGTRQGQDHVDLYDVDSDGTADHITVEEFRTASGDSYYRVGVMVFEEFEPIFLPRRVFGDDPKPIVTQAVAQLDSRSLRQERTDPMDCGLIVDGDTTTGEVGIKGNNFNIEDGDMCAEVPITFEKGKDDDFPIQQWDRTTCSDLKAPGGQCSNHHTYGNEKSAPRFVHTDPADYSVDMTQFSSWSGGPCSGGARAMETRSDTPVTWGSGGARVCVERTSGGGGKGKGKGKKGGSFDGYQFTNESGAEIQTTNGEPVSIYADDSIRFAGNGSGVSGGLYATQDVVIEKNSGQFVGDVGELDGLAVWAERDLIIKKNNNYFEGIVGAGRNLKFTSNGGGKHEIRGIVIAKNRFVDHANSNARDDITHDPNVFDRDALDLADWVIIVLGGADIPAYARSSAYLLQ